jgi:hypothetical protein
MRESRDFTPFYVFLYLHQIIHVGDNLAFGICPSCGMPRQHKVTDTDIQFSNHYFGISQKMDKVQKPDDPKRKIPLS